MDLVKQLVLAEEVAFGFVTGRPVRRWTWFRIEMSMQRVEYVCGVNLELPASARGARAWTGFG